MDSEDEICNIPLSKLPLKKPSWWRPEERAQSPPSEREIVRVWDHSYGKPDNHHDNVAGPSSRVWSDRLVKFPLCIPASARAKSDNVVVNSDTALDLSMRSSYPAIKPIITDDTVVLDDMDMAAPICEDQEPQDDPNSVPEPTVGGLGVKQPFKLFLTAIKKKPKKKIRIRKRN